MFKYKDDDDLKQNPKKSKLQKITLNNLKKITLNNLCEFQSNKVKTGCINSKTKKQK